MLTSVGKKMSIFPIDPKFSKILLNGPEFGCLEEVKYFESYFLCSIRIINLHFTF